MGRWAGYVLAISTTLASASALAAPPALSHVSAISVGDANACAVDAGVAKCWGRNDQSDLGDGTPDADRPVPAPVPGLPGATIAVAVGGNHACALTAGHDVYCWGRNAEGQLGDGTTHDRRTPVLVQGLQGNTVAIAAGDKHTCAITTSGAAKCWGSNFAGQVGNGTSRGISLCCDATTPQDVVGLGSGVSSITAGGLHTCAITTGGRLYCWGSDREGQIGDDGAPSPIRSTDPQPVPTPVIVSGLQSGVVSVSAGALHTCAVVAGGVKCWGNNVFGAGGTSTSDTTFGSRRTTPGDVAGLTSGIASVASGGSHTCALTTTGAVKCWGDRTSGQLGDGTVAPFAGSPPSGPVTVSGLASGVVAISAGTFETCALTSTQQMMCWGGNGFGQIGNYARALAQATPAPVLDVQLQAITFAAIPNQDPSAGSVSLSASADSGLPVSFTSLTPSVCDVSGTTLTLAAQGVCSVAADQAGNADIYKANRVVRAFIVAPASAFGTPRLAAISTRGIVRFDDDILIAGFVVPGPSPKTVLVRARGPSLAITGALTNPSLEIVNAAASRVGLNEDWRTGANAATLEALGIAPADDLESAVLLTLQPGAYTALVRNRDITATGTLAIIEVLELDRPDEPLAGISTRARAETGDNVVIAGFVVQGNAPQKVMIRARGPSLAASGVSQALADPTLTLVRASDGAVIAANNDWQSSANAAEIQASGFQPSDPKESAILTTLPPGAYTALMSGANNTVGVGIVEVFEQ